MDNLTELQERHQSILDLLRRREYATVDELSKLLGVSGSTVRSDLRELESTGQLRRVHGGAQWTEAVSLVPDYAARLKIQVAEKRQIAEVAATLVGDYSVVGLDGSSTAFYLARRLAGRNLTVVTNGIYAALELGSSPSTRVILVGGEVRLSTGSTIGHMGRNMLGRVRSDEDDSTGVSGGLRIRQFFTSPGGLTVSDGLMDLDPDENLIKEDMIAVAEEVIVLVDSSKVGHRALLPYARLGSISYLITDDQVDPAYVKRLEKAGVRVLVAPGPSVDSRRQNGEEPMV